MHLNAAYTGCRGAAVLDGSARRRGMGPKQPWSPAARRQRQLLVTATAQLPAQQAAPAQAPAPAAAASPAPAAQQGPPGPPPPEPKLPATQEIITVSPRVSAIRTVCEERMAEIEFSQKRGTTTNSYLVKGGNGAFEALIDVPSKVFDADIVTALGMLGATPTLRHIIITRLTPERVPTLLAIINACPLPIQLLMTNPAMQLLRDKTAGNEAAERILSRCKLTAVTRASTLTLSGNRVLKFIPVPTPRWPDLVAVYSEADKLLFSSNFFSAHAADGGQGSAAAGMTAMQQLMAKSQKSSGWDDGGWAAYGADWRHYFECMLAPVARQAAVALERLDVRVNAGGALPRSGPMAGLMSALSGFLEAVEELTMGADDGVPEPMEVVGICPMHGPLIRASITELLSRYAEWTEAQVKAASECSVAVLYASAYGNTATLAQAISHGITKAGVGVETINLELVSADEVDKVLEKANGFVLGSPTLGGHMPTPVQAALGAILRSSVAKRLPCGVYGSFGWSGEAVDIIEGKLKDAGFKLAFDSIRCKFKPTQATLQQCEESGTDLAQTIKKALKKQEKAAAGGMAVAESTSAKAQALGRVVGTLCVLTARDGDATGAMLASWVTQASFNPPGFTVAVKKDRAIESLLVVGAKFVLNILGEGKEKGPMKQMLKPFKPGEDRFAGMEVLQSEATGAPIIPEAAAYLECSVASRMEAGDHWLIYATVQDGQVLDEGTQSAVHYRKVGTNY